MFARIDPNDLIPGAKHFYWREVLWLHKWQIHAIPTQKQAENLIHVITKLERIREIYNAPINITSGLRPGIYNSYIGGAHNSAHKYGQAIDFQINNFTTQHSCNEIRYALKSQLQSLDLYMEDLSVANWIHIQTRPTRLRFFKP